MTKKTVNYLIVGGGKTGLSIARYLTKRERSFALFDTRSTLSNLKEWQTQFSTVPLYLGELPETVTANIIEVIASPGVDLEHPQLKMLQQKGVPIIGDIECLAREIKAPVVGITGTNGKSTVTTLVGEMAKKAQLKVAVAGNIGLPVLDALEDGNHYDLWVLELSSFQLELTHSLQYKAATILNISPDHLDRHPDLAHYIQAKQRIYQNTEIAVYNQDDAETYPDAAFSLQKKISFGLNKPAKKQWGIIEQQGESYLAFDDEPLLAVDTLGIQGKQNWQNALAAAALAEAINIPLPVICSVLTSFKGLPHRCQPVRRLQEIAWINDSKGTNIGATYSAIEGIGATLKGKIILIAGGLGKGADFTELCSVVKQYVRAVIVIGTDALLIDAALKTTTAVFHAASLEEAVLLAQQKAQPSDAVLLSPACASQDMFRDFNHRGERFIALVEAL